jgi:hypothetical protein
MHSVLGLVPGPSSLFWEGLVCDITRAIEKDINTNKQQGSSRQPSIFKKWFWSEVQRLATTASCRRAS